MHEIQALVLPAADPDAARAWDLATVPLAGSELSLVHVTHYVTAYWQARRGVSGHLVTQSSFPATFPRERVLHDIAVAVTGVPDPLYAVVMTEYFGGVGEQCAAAYRVPGLEPVVAGSINEALRALGVTTAPDEYDEFDTVGLGHFRSTPDHLDRFADLCDELGV
jgi:hypothetical protein